MTNLKRELGLILEEIDFEIEAGCPCVEKRVELLERIETAIRKDGRYDF